ncbi:flagellar biosynthesis regulator FlaF [Novosphingobium sp. M1R2S20]|uniref:Flagellar biosynthesis regulator FlaF n=1 Tax=Novosphingobium rhizovicinum TaxID=3228928 RepID=A0ABV3R8X5_9SPHN
MSLSAYQRVKTIAESPRNTEFRLVSQITGEMIAARDAGLTGTALMAALHRNREMWGAFSSACGAPGNALPDTLRAGIISLALWVDRFTTEVVTGRESIEELIGVNRLLLEGLAPEQMAA